MALTLNVASSVAQAMVASERHHFSITTTDAAAAINQFSAQANLQIAASGVPLNGKQLHPINGDLTVTEGLTQLLAGTGLTPKFVGNRAVALVAAAPAEAAPRQLAAPVAGPPSAAVPTSESTVLLEEIVVTAQFRSQSLETTPLAITAISGQSLDNRNMRELADLSPTTPSLLAQRGQQSFGPITNLFIRGVGQSDNIPASEPGVGVYIDDVYHGLLLGSDFELADLDRVEILRGPQGTLEGKNSLGGAVKLFSKQPGEDTNGYLDATYGDFNRVELRGAGSFTVVPDTLYARVSGLSRRVDGYMTRLDYACAHPGTTVPSDPPSQAGCKLGTEGGENVQGLRLALRYLAGDSVEDTLTLDDTADRSEPPASKLLLLNNTGIPGGGSQFITGAHSYATYATYSQLPFTDSAGAHPGFSIPTTNSTNAYGLANSLEWKFVPGYSLKSITGYRRYDGHYSSDEDGSPYTTQLVNPIWSDSEFSQQLRLNGMSFDLLDWTVGAYYYHQLAHYGGLKLLSPGAPTEQFFTGSDAIPSTSRSGFAHGVWHLTDALNLITGIRYTKESKDYTFSRVNPFNPAARAYTSNGLLNGLTGSYAGSRVDYRAGLEYQWTDTLMTYAQWSTGFKGGGVNPRPFIIQEEVPFRQETLTASEIGLKDDLFNHRLRINIATYFNKYHDIVFTNQTPVVVNGIASPNATPVNAGDANIWGAELELAARPWQGLQVDLSGSYLHFRFTRIATGENLGNVTLNTKEPYAPQSKASLGVQYEVPCGAYGSLTPRADATYQASFFTAIDNSPNDYVAGYTLVNARLTWKSPHDEWESSLSLLNATDKFYYINKFYVAPPFNFAEGTPGAPREWMVTVRRNF